MDDNFIVNGINGASGEYLLPQLSVEEVGRLARGQLLQAEHLEELRARSEGAAPNFGLVHGVDPEDLAQAGWGVVFAHDAGDDLRQALAPLLDLRRAQAGQRYREYRAAGAYRPDETARAWLARCPRKKAPGPADPTKVPYYLLIVGDPESIPFRFQYELDVNYAVGRVYFDSLDGYARYARSVVESEQRGRRTPVRHAVFFGVRNRGDRATQLSADTLVEPLARLLTSRHAEGWQVETILAEQATKQRLHALVEAGVRPSILFTASHGMGFRRDDARQELHQGALLCQDWPGPISHKGPIPPNFYFSADDLSDDADASGMVAFHFACFGGGTPRWDDYAHRGSERLQIASRAFVARLPQRLLSLPGGGALAVVGHVERTWGYSFTWPEAGADLAVFESTMDALMAGRRLGSAMDAFGLRYADLAVQLSNELEDAKFGAVGNNEALARLWTAHNDSRSLIVLGDPAVRLT